MAFARISGPAFPGTTYYDTLLFARLQKSCGLWGVRYHNCGVGHYVARIYTLFNDSRADAFDEGPSAFRGDMSRSQGVMSSEGVTSRHPAVYTNWNPSDIWGQGAIDEGRRGVHTPKKISTHMQSKYLDLETPVSFSWLIEPTMHTDSEQCLGMWRLGEEAEGEVREMLSHHQTYWKSRSQDAIERGEVYSQMRVYIYACVDCIYIFICAYIIFAYI